MPGGYQVIIRPPAEKDFRSLPKGDQVRVGRRIQLLTDTPRPPGCKKLGEPGIFRVRQGDYRVIYQVDDAQRIVQVLRIAHRREAYR
ncbi:MAG: type II toxin-antitoxin system RelE/ParE family toxin [Acidobacteria bacterium]|nr:type II toxin-antitoxin system RelE/ParE family toxin [Acidobacteriota bacterium]